MKRPAYGNPGSSPQEHEVRSLDGSGNNLSNARFGAARERLRRLVSARYEGGLDRPAGAHRPNPSAISEIVCNQGKSKPHAKLTDMMWAWGQFLDHEMDLSPEGHDERFDIPPLNEPGLPKREGHEFARSVFDRGTGRDHSVPREQINVLSAYIDGANVYGVEENRAAFLRANDGSGKLRVSDDGLDLLPRDTHRLPNAFAAPKGLSKAKEEALRDSLFIAGDIRANEHAVLISMHTLFVREHNRLCDVARRRHRGKDDDFYFQYARRRVGAFMQAVTYEEFLPALLGKIAFEKGGRIGPYEAYDPTIDAGISNMFSTACYRLGHSMLSPSVRTPGATTDTMDFEKLFFGPGLVRANGIEPFLVGVTQQHMQKIDARTVDAVRKLLFNRGLDLAALNLQRGRDHGLPSLNEARVGLGLPAHRDFAAITQDVGTARALNKAYDHPDDIDVWVGGLAETPVDDAEVGELFHVVLCDQFRRLRDGDRFWYQNDPALAEETEEIQKTTLSMVMARNLEVRSVRKKVFEL